MDLPDFKFKWIGHVDVPDYAHNLWGVFSVTPLTKLSKYSSIPQLFFQCKSMKSIVITQPSPNYYAIQHMIDLKKARKYEEISLKDLLVKWPNFLNELNSSYIHFKLRNYS